MMCLSVGKATVEECLEIIKDAELAEIRLDLNIYTEEELERIFSSGTNLIATCREGKYDNSERKYLMRKSIDFGAKYVDLDITWDYDLREYMVNAAKKAGCKVIVSYHNYEKCPNRENMIDIINRCFDNNADIAKVVCKANSNEDNANIMSLYNLKKDIIALGMGKLGKISRVAAPFLGAPFTYVYPKDRKRTAEGQFSEEKMKEIINLMS